MKITDERELANILGMAFHKYANVAENGGVSPFEPFIQGETSVTVVVSLKADGSIGIAKYVPPEPAVVVQIAEPQPEIPTDTPLLEKLEPEPEVIEEPKPKRKRKTPE